MRTISSIVTFAIVATSVACLTLFGWRFAHPRKPGPPAIIYPEVVEMGAQEFGSNAIGRFRVRNEGETELHLSHFATSCSCAGVEIEEEGVSRKVEEIRIPPASEVELSVRISIAMRPGTSQTVLVKFVTSCPAHPDASLRVLIPRVTGGLTSEPTAVVFGDIPVGKLAIKTVRLYRNGISERKIQSVRSLRPDRFAVRLMSEDIGSADELVGVVEVTAIVDRPGSLEGSIEVVLAGEARASDKIAVLGEVIPSVVTSPTSLVLPRSAQGKLVYSSQTVLTSRDGLKLNFVVESVPIGLTAAIRQDSDKPDQWILDVTADSENRIARKATVRLRAEVISGGTYTLDFPITILSPNP